MLKVNLSEIKKNQSMDWKGLLRYGIDQKKKQAYPDKVLNSTC